MQLMISPADDVRRELVDRMRAEIAGGTYPGPVEVDGAIDRICSQVVHRRDKGTPPRRMVVHV